MPVEQSDSGLTPLLTLYLRCVDQLSTELLRPYELFPRRSSAFLTVFNPLSEYLSDQNNPIAYGCSVTVPEGRSARIFERTRRDRGGHCPDGQCAWTVGPELIGSSAITASIGMTSAGHRPTRFSGWLCWDNYQDWPAKGLGGFVPACRPRHVAKAAKTEKPHVLSIRSVYFRIRVPGTS